jgi:uncharacterized protein (TIGR03435 family)
LTVKANLSPFNWRTLTPVDTSPGRYVATNLPLNLLVITALGPGENAQVEGVPEWTSDVRYDIVATTGGPKTQPEVRDMLRTLLKERFKLTWHRETRPAKQFHLVRADGSLGPDITPSAIDCDVLQRERMAKVQSALADAQQNGKTLPIEERTISPQPGCSGQTTRGVTTLTLEGTSMAGLANRLPAGGKVIDRTGLAGTYAVQLRFESPTARRGPSTQPLDDAPQLAAALREQLGLKLEPGEGGTADFIVIDHIERLIEER